ncbi:MAG TPA: AmmeMemoRadiSam system protein B [Micromonosporaceae bacterium]
MRDVPRSSGRGVRAPAVAGRFYPADAGVLAVVVDRLVGDVATPADEAVAAAYVVPHAGYQFSGPTAAHAYARLHAQADRVRRVVLLGPAHYVELSGCAVPAVEAWRTPLGEVPIDTALVDRLAGGGHVTVDDRPHVPEHSLEVQLPFLQRVLPGGVPVLPIVVGPSSVDVVIGALSLAADPGTVVVCSTDLSHYLDDPTARRQDQRTAQAVLDLAEERIGVRDACGVFALRGLVSWARRVGLRPTLLDLSTSADTAGDPTRVVGYAAFALHPAPA